MPSSGRQENHSPSTGLGTA